MDDHLGHQTRLDLQVPRHDQGFPVGLPRHVSDLYLVTPPTDVYIWFPHDLCMQQCVKMFFQKQHIKESKQFVNVSLHTNNLLDI